MAHQCQVTVALGSNSLGTSSVAAGLSNSPGATSRLKAMWKIMEG